MTAPITVRLGENDIPLPGVGYDAFVEYLYRTPSQPELLGMRKSDIIAAYNAIAPQKSLPTGSHRRVGNGHDWDANYSALKSYHAKHGNCSVPFGKETGSLRSWTERQKKLYASGQLESDRIEKMNALDFDFSVKPLSTRSINTSARSAAAPKPTNSKSSVVKSTTSSSAAKKTKPVQLEKKQSSKRQKQEVKFSNPPAPQAPPVVRNSSLRIEDNETWNKNYETLKAFQAKHGNCTVPFGKETGALRSWTERQKKLYASSKLDEEKVAKMTEIGFAF